MCHLHGGTLPRVIRVVSEENAGRAGAAVLSHKFTIFQGKNLHFLLKNHHFVLQNHHFLLQNLQLYVKSHLWGHG